MKNRYLSFISLKQLVNFLVIASVITNVKLHWDMKMNISMTHKRCYQITITDSFETCNVIILHN